MMKPTAPHYSSVDLFAGAGGFSAGLLAAGIECIAVVEKNEDAGVSFARNFPDCSMRFLGPRQGDITTIDASMLLENLKAAGLVDLDLLVAGPPCQGFSRVGRGKLLSLSDCADAFLNDPRNSLYTYAIKFLHVLRPRVFVFENVAGMLHIRGQNMVEPVCEAVTRSGYRVKCALLNSAWYGVPQMRERVIIIGIRNDLEIEPRFPEITHYVQLSRGHLGDADLDPRNWKSDYFVPFEKLPRRRELLPAVTVADAFADLPSFNQHLRAKGRTYSSLRYLHESVEYLYETPPNEYCSLMRNWNGHFPSKDISDHYCRNTPRDFETFGRMKPGDRYPDASRIAKERFSQAVETWRQKGGKRPRQSDFVPPYSLDGFPDKWRKLIPTQPSWTVTAHLGKDTYSHIHYDSKQKRMITVREAARLQSFPDGFQFQGCTGEVFRQIGNAVPPLLAYAIGRAVFDILWMRDSSGKPREYSESNSVFDLVKP